MHSNISPDMTYIKATPSQAVVQLNQFVLNKQLAEAGKLHVPKASPLDWLSIQACWLGGFIRVVWYMLSLEKNHLF
ncbi:MAG: hypothetical protein AAF921_00730 [Cyanobacteria bacterium P01_D01_bin.44]